MSLHLIADDLTGALDTAAQFALAAPVAVHWTMPERLPARVALDSGTREGSPEAAHATVRALAARLPEAPDALRYAKLDSLLRGHAAAEIAAWIEAVRPAHCVIAPAFPFNGRATRGGRQGVLSDGTWTPVACDLAADLAARGLAPTLCRPGDALPPGVSLWDAETDADLAAIVAAGRAARGPVLWAGTGGLAAALAGVAPPAGDAFPPPDLPRPLLGLFGTHHPATLAQLAPLATCSATETAAVAEALQGAGVALVTPGLPEGPDPAAAAVEIARRFGALAATLPRPGSLIVSGGETLRALCESLGADHLDLTGQIVPGVPASILRGGRWDGVRVVSKSGAFGKPPLLGRLLAVSPSSEFCK